MAHKPTQSLQIAGQSIAIKDLLGALFFLLIWIAPITFQGLTNTKISWMPKNLSDWQSISNLFPLAVPVWPALYVQGRHKNSDEWITLKEEDYFAMPTFGYRTRLFEAIYYPTSITDYKRKTQGTRQELAAYVAQKYSQIHKNQPALSGVRFAVGLFHVDPKSPPQSHWTIPPFESWPEEQRHILSTHIIDENNNVIPALTSSKNLGKSCAGMTPLFINAPCQENV